MNQNVLTVLLLGIAVTAQAQQPEQRTPTPAPTQRGADRASDRGGGRTLGPFDTWPREARRPGTSSPTALANTAQVQDELKLTPEQKQALADLTKKLTDEQVKLYTETQNRALVLNQEADNAVKQLLDPTQLARLEQLRLQREGVNTLFSPEVAEKLALTVEQRAKLTKLQADLRNASSFSAAGGPGSGTSRATAWRENTTRIQAEMIAVLTPEQKAKYDVLLGPTFEFPVRFSGFAPSTAPAPRTPTTSGFGGFTNRSRAQAFELGARTLRGADPARTPSMRFVEAFSGPIGPFRYKATVEALALTDEQKTQIQTIGAEDVAAVQKLIDDATPDPAAKVREINDATREKLNKVLTEDQKAKLQEMTSR
jgi:Spy/CpxP family protein refolding chaperone